MCSTVLAKFEFLQVWALLDEFVFTITIFIILFDKLLSLLDTCNSKDEEVTHNCGDIRFIVRAIRKNHFF